MRDKNRFIYKAYYFIICLFLLYVPSLLFSVSKNTIVGGVCSLDKYSIADGKILTLNGEWEFFYDKLIYTEKELQSTTLKADTYTNIPHVWKNVLYLFSNKSSSKGVGSYRLTINNLFPNKTYAILLNESPGTAASFYINGELQLTTGIVSKNKDEYKPQAIPCYIECTSDKDGSIEIVIEVANFIHRKGGLWTTIYFGDQSAVRKRFNLQSGSRYFICCLLLFICFLNLCHFVLNRYKIDTLCFALFCLLFAIRISIAEFSILTLAFPNFPYGLQLKLEYSIIWFAPILFLLFSMSFLPKMIVTPISIRIFISVSTTLGIVGLCLPISITNYFVVFYELVTLSSFTCFFIVLVRALISGEKGILPYFISMAIGGSGLITEIIFNNTFNKLTISLLPIIMVIFCSIHFYFMSKRQVALYLRKKHVQAHLKQVNKTYSRYVPYKLYSQLGREDAIGVKPGTFVRKNATTLFIKTVIQGSEKEQFNTFSSFTADAFPVITGHSGYVSVAKGTSLTVIFPESPDLVINCCFTLLSHVEKRNREKAIMGLSPLSFYAAIHYGDVILGLTGNNQQIFGSAVSEAVEIAEHIASYARSVRRSIVISRNAVETELNDQAFPHTLIPLGVITLKRNHQPIQLYECIPETAESGELL